MNGVTRLTRTLIAVGLTLAMFACPANAALFAPTVDSVSSELTAFGRHAVHSVDGSGLTGTGAAGSTHADGENGIAWTTPGSLGGGFGTDYDPEITYDLGGAVDVTTMRIWNYNSSFITNGSPITIIGPDQVGVFTSLDGVGFTSQGTVNFAQAPGANGYTGQDIAVNYPGVRYIRFDILTNHDGAVFDGTGAQGGTIDGRSLTGLSEVRFEGRPWGLMSIRPEVAQVSSQNPYGIDRAAIHTVDASGLSGPGNAGDTHVSASNGTMWTTVGSAGPGTDLDPFITYDLGDLFDVSAMRIWNYNEAGFSRAGVDTMEVFAGRDLGSMTSQGVFALPQAPGAGGYAGVEVPLSLAGVRFIQFDILTNHDGAVFDGTGTQQGLDGRSLTGLSEVRFVGKLIPEPGTLTLLGMAALALLRRRRT